MTLHVGAGTFLPVKTDKISDHTLHAEWYRIAEDAARIINRCRSEGGRLIAVGTTSLRVLETAARDDGLIEARQGFTKIFITAGPPLSQRRLPYDEFPSAEIDAFHAGLRLLRNGSHEEGLTPTPFQQGFRFYSYGDACLLRRAEGPTL